MADKRKIIDIAKEQLALDYNCNKKDFDKDENTIVLNDLVEGRRIKASEDSYFRAVCIGGKAIINVGEELLPWFKETYKDFNCAWFFEYENLRKIESKLKEVGHEIEDIHHYYLPLVDMKNVEPIMKVKWYDDRSSLYMNLKINLRINFLKFEKKRRIFYNCKQYLKSMILQ